MKKNPVMQDFFILSNFSYKATKTSLKKSINKKRMALLGN